MLLCDSGDSSEELRGLAATLILSNSDKYSSVILGQSNQEYVKWLKRKESWGGEGWGRREGRGCSNHEWLREVRGGAEEGGGGGGSNQEYVKL